MITKTDKLLKEFINLHPKYIDLSLNRLNRLLKKLGNPQNKLQNVVNIVGTNAKASMAYSLKSILNKFNCS